jgi:hypothetical protein
LSIATFVFESKALFAPIRNKNGGSSAESIAIHGLEHLASSDKGVILFRKILREAIHAMREARDPKGIIRDPNKAKRIATTGGSIVRD